MEPGLTKAKFASMLMLGHSIAASGNLFEIGLVFGMNRAQMLAMLPTTLAWIRESSARERRINASLDREWTRLHTEATHYT